GEGHAPARRGPAECGQHLLHEQRPAMPREHPAAARPPGSFLCAERAAKGAGRLGAAALGRPVHCGEPWYLEGCAEQRHGYVRGVAAARQHGIRGVLGGSPHRRVEGGSRSGRREGRRRRGSGRERDGGGGFRAERPQALRRFLG
ncbi:unnamed protein product, partial [Effrenium voratum]